MQKEDWNYDVSDGSLNVRFPQFDRRAPIDYDQKLLPTYMWLFFIKCLFFTIWQTSTYRLWPEIITYIYETFVH